MPENLKKSLAGLNEEGLRNALAVFFKAINRKLPEELNEAGLRRTLTGILEDNHIGARALFETFCNPPTEPTVPAAGSQPPNRFYVHCAHALRAYPLDAAVKEIESVYGKIEAVYTPEEVPWKGKFAGNRLLLRIAALVSPIPQWNSLETAVIKTRLGLVAKAFQTMGIICVSMDLGDCEHLYDTNEWEQFVRRCKSVGHGIEKWMLREVDAQLDHLKGDEMSYSDELEFRALELQYDMENEDEGICQGRTTDTSGGDTEVNVHSVSRAEDILLAKSKQQPH